MEIEARNSDYTKKYNRKLVLHLLRYQSLSRAEIARQTGLTRASTSLIASELISDGSVYEDVPVASQRGRSPTPLVLSASAGYAIGIYLNRDSCSLGLVDARGNILSRQNISLGSSSDETLQNLQRGVTALLEHGGIPKQSICGIGISAPGPLDSENGRILNPPRFEHWHGMNIVEQLHQKTELPVHLANNAICLASYLCGRAESCGSRDFLLLLVDSGVGSGVVSDGKVFRSKNHFTSEIGHVSINSAGRPCACGNIGCLEEYAALPKLLSGSGFTNWADVVDHLNESDSARLLFQQEVDYLSAGVLNLCNLICIDAVFLAGDITYGGEKLAAAMEEIVNRRCIYHEQGRIRVCVPPAVEGIQILSAAELPFSAELGL